MSDRDDIIELTSNLGLLVDARDWTAVETLFDDTVDLDYTSLQGGEPQRLAPSDIVATWKENLVRLKSTQHLIANHVVALTHEQGHVAANVTATHVASDATGDSHWVVGGRYDLVVRRSDNGWRIAALKLTVAWTTGNQAIMMPDR